MKVSLCAIIKHENKYIREWIEYYKNLGFDHIYLYDNNELDYEPLDTLLKDYKWFVTLLNVRDVKNDRLQYICYEHCYKHYSSLYDWMAFFDADEFLYIKDKGLVEYLSQPKFADTSIIHFNWRYYGDNGLLHYEDRPVQERFPEPADINVKYAQKHEENYHVKSIINCKYELIEHGIHTAKMKGGICRKNNGEITNMMNSVENYNYDEAWIKHYGTKSIEEYLERRSMNTRITGEPIPIETRIKWFFNVNKWTPEKQAIIDEFLKNRN